MSDAAIVDGTNGASGDDILIATDDGSKLVGGSGDDTLVSGSGDDILNGGSGTDIAYYDANVQVFVNDDGVLTLYDEKGNTIVFDAGEFGTDTLKSIEIIKFNNYTYYMDGTNNAVLAVNDAGDIDQNSTITDFNVLSNDLDLDGDALTVTSIDTSGSTGIFTLNIDGEISYDPAGGFNYLAAGETATDTVTYTVTDGNGSITTAEFTVTITGINDAPVAVEDLTTTDENTAVLFDVLDNDTDVDLTDSHTIVDGSVNITSGLGSASIVGNKISWNPGSDYDYLAVNESIDVVIAYTMSDGNGGSSSSTLTITVSGANDAPIVSGTVISGSTEDDPAFSVALLDGASDVDSSDSLTIADLTLTGGDGSGVTLNGTSLDVDSNAYNYLNDGENAVITYQYNVIDGNGGITPQTATITITGINDAPAILEGAVTDGYIVGATVFSDNNDNGVFDAGDVTTTTSGIGGFSLEGATGDLYMSGGTDVATGLTFDGVLRAPAGSTSITALTTLVAEVGDQEGYDPVLQVGYAFGIPAISNSILTTDPIEAILSGDSETGMTLMSLATQVLNTVVQVASLVEGASGGTITISDAMDAVFAELSTAIINWSPYNLTNSGSISTLIDNLTAGLAPEVQSSAASLIANTNTAVENISVEGVDFLTAVTQVSIVAQGESSEAMSTDASTGTAINITAIDAALETLISDAVVGDIDGGKPVFTYEPVGNVDLIRSNLLPDEGDFMLYDYGTGELVSSGEAGQLIFDTTTSVNSSNRLQITHSYDNEFASVGMADYGIVYQGGTGADWLFFGIGSEQYSLGVNIEAHGGAGNDRLSGGKDGDDLLYGDAGNDDLTGLSGNDVIVGGRGNDNLTGGRGSDQFVFENGDANDVGNEFDIIYDFSISEGDILDLTGLLSDATNGLTEDGASLQNFLDFSSDGERTWVNVDLDGNTVADQIIYLDGVDLTQVPVDVPDLVSYQVNTANFYTSLGTNSGHIYADNIFSGGGFGTYDTVNGGQSLASGSQLVIDNSSLTTSTTYLNNTGGDFSSYLTEDYGFVFLGGSGSDYLYIKDHSVPLGTNIEAHGGAGNDSIQGGEGSDLLYGDNGNDSLNGFAGNDILVGGFGKDTLNGGDGADTFMFIQGEQNFNSGSDYADFVGNDSLFDFSVAEGDVLDLTDLLSDVSGLDESGEGLDAILNFTADKKLLIDVDGDGIFSESTDLDIDFGFYSDDLNQAGTLSDVEVIDSLLASDSLDVVYTGTGTNAEIIDNLLAAGSIDLI